MVFNTKMRNPFTDKPFSGFQQVIERYAHTISVSFDNFSEENSTIEPIKFV